MRKTLLPIVLAFITVSGAKAGVSWTSSPPGVVAANSSYSVGAQETAVSSEVEVYVYRNGANVAGGGNGGPGNTQISCSASDSSSQSSGSVSWSASGYAMVNGSMVSDGSVSGTTLTNSSPSAWISGSTSLNVGQTGSWSFGATDSEGNLSNWRFYASTNSNPQWSGASGSSVSGSYSTSFSSPGSYSWIVDAKDAFGLTSSDSITVTVTNPTTPTTFTVSPTSFTYNGSSQGPSISPSPSNASFTTTGTPSATNAGNYSVTATATGSYSGTSGAVSWSIAPASASFTFSGGPSFTYDGTAKSVSVDAHGATYTTSGTWSATNAGTYTATVTATGNYTGSASYTWTIDPASVSFTFSGGPLFTQDGTTKSVSVSASPGGASYSQLGTWSASAAGSYTATATATGNYVGSGSYSWSISSGAPTVTSQPVDVDALTNDDVTFSAAATGSNNSYQWRKNGTNINGATGSTLALTNVSKSDAGSYDVFVYNNYGSVTSRQATLTVDDPPVMLSVDDPVLNADGTVTVRASAQDSDGNLHMLQFLVSYPAEYNGYWQVGVATISGSQATGEVTFNPADYGPNHSPDFPYQPYPDGTYYVWVRAYDTPQQAIDSNGGAFNAFTLGSASGTSVSVSPYEIAPGDTVAATYDGAPSGSWIGLYNYSAADSDFLVQQTVSAGNGSAPITTNSSFVVGQTYNARLFGSAGTSNRIATSNGFSVVDRWGLTVVDGTIDGANGQSYFPANTVLNLTANDPPTGEQFIGWTITSGPGSFGDASQAHTTFTTGAGYALVRANYQGKPQISSPTTASGDIYHQFTYTLTATNSPTSYTISGLPPGLSYHYDYNPDLVLVVDGQPTQYGDFPNITVSATNAAGSGYGVLSFHIDGAATDAAPTIPDTGQPKSSQTAALGYPFSLTVQATGSPQPTYQWYKDGNVIAGATASTIVRNSASESDAGVYTVVVTNRVGSTTSEPATVNVGPAAAPTITTQPQGGTVTFGGSITLTVQATGVPDVSYQWLKDNHAIVGATESSLELTNLTSADAGAYSVLVTNAIGGIVSDTAVVALTYAAGDSDHNGFDDGWEQQYFGRIGVDPNQVLANGLTALQAYNLRIDPNLASYTPNSTGPGVTVKITAIGKGGNSGGNDVTLTIDGDPGSPHTFGFPSSAGNPWTSGWNSTVSIQVPFGSLRTVHVSSTGDSASDYFIRADIDPETLPLLSSAAEFDGRLFGGIRKSEIQNNQFTLAVRPKSSVPFATFDDSNLRLQQQIALGLGRGRSGRSAGEVLVSLNGGVSVYQGEALEGSVETDPTHFQAKAPAGYVDIIHTHDYIYIKFYDDETVFTPGTYQTFSGNPVAIYTVDLSESVVSDPAPAPSHTYGKPWSLLSGGNHTMLTRTAGGVSYELEWENFSLTAADDEQTYGQDRDGDGVEDHVYERWTTHYDTITDLWPWRKASSSRTGLTRLEFDRPVTQERTSQILPYQYPGDISYSFAAADFYTTEFLDADETATIGYSDHYNTDNGDLQLVRAQLLTRGIGGDQQEMPRRQLDSGDWNHPGTTDLNGLGGSTYTEFFGHEMVLNGDDNFDGGEPYVADGQPRQVRRSFLDNALNTATDITSTYSYIGNDDLIDGFPRPSGVTAKQGSTTIGQTTYSYSTGTLNGHNTFTTTETKSDGGSDPLVTITRIYSQRLSSYPDLQGKPLAITRPDGTKVSYAYFYSGDDFVVAELNGKAHDHGSPGNQVSSYSGASIDPLDLEADKSTVTERTFSSQGRLTREATYLYHGAPGYQLLSEIHYTYDALGHLLTKTDFLASRVLYSANYTGFQKDDEIDEQGTALSYTYDDDGHVETMTRAGATAGALTVPSVVTTYGYDGLGRLATETVGGAGAVVTSYTYDTAGRPKSTTKFSTATAGSGSPGALVTLVSYSSPDPTVTTTTFPDGGTKVETKFKDGRPKSVAGTAVPDTEFTYAYNSSGQLVTTQKYSNALAHYVKTTADWVGRTVSVETPTYGDGSQTGSTGAAQVVTNTYDDNQLRRQDTKVGTTQIAPAHVFEYDDYGRLKREGLKTGAGDTVTGGTDYDVKEYEFGFAQNPSGVGSGWYRFDNVKAWPYAGAGVSTSHYASQTYTQVGGLGSTTVSHVVALDFDGNKTETTATVDRANATLTTDTTSTGTTATIRQIMLAGLLVSSTNAQGQTTLQTYDALGRLSASDDPRTGPTDYVYQPDTTLVATTTPPDSRSVGYGYDPAGRVNVQTDAAGSAYFQYDLVGNLTHQWGDTVNPVKYDYNDLGQRTAMHTYRSGTWTGNTLPSGFSGAGDVTTWSYQAATGLLLAKTDAASAATHYTYTDLGQVASRTDARSIVTTYAYYGATETTGGAYPTSLHSVSYSDGTPTVTYQYDHAGRYDQITDAAGTRTFTYDDTSNASARLQTESLPTFFGSHTIGYDYQFGVAGRANGALNSLKLDSGALYDVAYAYDDTLRVQTVTYNSGTPFTYAYVPNSNLVDTVTQSGGYERDYDYKSDSNRLDKVKHFWNSVQTTETRLTYDTVGRRQTEKTQGAAWMTALGRGSEAGVDADTSYTDRSEVTSSGKYMLGSDWTVGAARTGTARDYVYDPIGNRTSTQDGTWTPNALNQYTAMPGFSTLTYDANGNIAAAGVWAAAYDAENRLISITIGGASYTFKYDYLGRRIEKSGTGIATTRYVYDGWNVIAELDGTGTLGRRFVWGLDVSGSLQGAGGVGGLLEIDTGSAIYFPLYDASHNVIGLYNSTGGLAAAYEYDPFGNVQTVAGSYGAANPFRSATKYTDDETGLVYYGMRYYSPQLGRFVNRDPIEEDGGLNLYGFCGNDGINSFDVLGMDPEKEDPPVVLDPITVEGSGTASTPVWRPGQ